MGNFQGENIMGMLWKRLGNRNFYLTVAILVIVNMLLNSTVSNFILSKINIKALWLVEGISMFIISLVTLIACLEIFEI
jgi:hypothetical protein